MLLQPGGVQALGKLGLGGMFSGFLFLFYLGELIGHWGWGVGIGREREEDANA